MSTPAGLSAKPCVDAIVAGDGYEVFGLTSAGSLQDVSGRCVELEAGKVEFRQCSNVRGVWEMTAEGQVKQGNMCLALSPGVVAMDCQEAAAVGAGSFFPVAVPKRPSSCRWSAQPRQACASKRCKAEQALGHVKFAHAEACHLQDQSKFDGKRQASDFRSGILFQSCCGWHSGTGCSRQDWSAIWGGPLPTFTVDRRVCQSLGCSSQGSKLIETS